MWPLLLVLLPLGGDARVPAPSETVRSDTTLPNTAPLDTALLDTSRDPWHELDTALAAPAPSRSDRALAWGLLVRAFYTQSASEASNGPNDVSGQVLEDVDAYFSFTHEGVAGRVSADFDQGDARLEDAYASWPGFGWLGLTAGQFKPRVVRSGSLPAGELLLRERTFLGAAFDLWDDGFELGGHYDQFDYWLAVTDGANGQAKDHFWSARAEWAFYDAGWEDREGARGAPNHLRALLGLMWFTDVAQSAADGGGWGGDLALTFGPYAFHAEWADLDSSFARTIDVFNGHLITLGDGAPRSATLSRRVGAQAEAVLRLQSADDLDATEAFSLGANWTPGGGAARFVADLALVEGDTRDFSLFSVGVQVGSSGFSRPFTDPR
mgnify:CR=1 FL=1